MSTAATAATGAVGASAAVAIRIRGLRKTYRTRRSRQVAVSGLDMDVPAGGVHGFLGPNGSGKTTTLRMLLGLARPDDGSMEVFGHDVPDRLPDVIARVGAIIESPKLFPTFSGKRNLELLADAVGTPRSRVGAVLEEVGLADRGKDAYRGYSLGMKQRLAIAATLLKDPDLLIFDEPTNGLDPAGIREIRQTMRDLGDRGKTVLVSSHILSEVEQVADTVSIIGHGRLLGQGRVGDLLGAGSASRIRVGVADQAAARAVLERAGLTVGVDGPALVVDGVGDPAAITRMLAEAGLYLNELMQVRPDLESIFLQMTEQEGLS